MSSRVFEPRLRGKINELQFWRKICASVSSINLSYNLDIEDWFECNDIVIWQWIAELLILDKIINTW